MYPLSMLLFLEVGDHQGLQEGDINVINYDQSYRPSATPNLQPYNFVWIKKADQNYLRACLPYFIHQPEILFDLQAKFNACIAILWLFLWFGFYISQKEK